MRNSDKSGSIRATVVNGPTIELPGGQFWGRPDHMFGGQIYHINTRARHIDTTSWASDSSK